MPPTRSAPIPGSERDTQRRLKLYEVVLEWAERYRPFPPGCGYTAARHDPSPRSQEHSLEYYIAASTEQEAERQALNAFRKELKKSKGDLGYMLGKRMHRGGLFSQRPKKIVVSVQEVQVKGYQLSLERIVGPRNNPEERGLYQRVINFR